MSLNVIASALNEAAERVRVAHAGSKNWAGAVEDKYRNSSIYGCTAIEMACRVGSITRYDLVRVVKVRYMEVARKFGGEPNAVVWWDSYDPRRVHALKAAALEAV